MLFSFISTLAIYAGTMVFLREYFDVAFIFAPEVFSKIIIITIICWAPFYIIGLLYKKYFPQVHERVNA
jgi:phospholipid-translocating ATPase